MKIFSIKYLTKEYEIKNILSFVRYKYMYGLCIGSQWKTNLTNGSMYAFTRRTSWVVFRRNGTNNR